MDEVFSLENRKLQLQLSIEERRHEVEVCTNCPSLPLCALCHSLCSSQLLMRT